MGYALMFFILSYIYGIFGFIALSKNEKNTNNRLYFAITLLFAFWSIVNSVLFLISDPEIAAYIRKLTVFSWGTIYSLILYFMLRISGIDLWFNNVYKRVSLYTFLFVPVLMNIVLYLFYPYTASELEFTKVGWVATEVLDRGFFWDNYFYHYYSSFMIVTVIITILWFFKTTSLREKKYAKYLLLSFLVPLVLGTIFEVVLPLLGYSIINGITIIFSIFPMILILYIIEKFGFLDFGSEKIGTQVMALTSEGVIICDLLGDIENINDGALELLGYTDNLEIKNVTQIGLEINYDLEFKSKEMILINKGNSETPVLLTFKKITDSVGELYGSLIVFQDISELQDTKKELEILNNNLELKVRNRTVELSRVNINLVEEIKNREKAENEIKDIAYKDFLTGLYNRRYYEDSLVKYDKEEFYPISLVMADINGLKLINDAFGHNAGDALLIEASRLIKNSCRKLDVLSRIGGDEFVIIMPNTSGPEAEEVIKKINKESKKVSVHSIDLSISFGYRTKTEKSESIHEVFRYAEDLMYREKLLKIPSMRSGAIETILKTLYERDPDSEIHSRSVSKYSENIAIAYGMNLQEVSEAKTAGLLHDIGKILISDKIITKKGSLSNDEYLEMKNHPEIGFRVLNSTHEMRGISNIVLHHHERWDGEGYPIGVKGDKIPFMSRIIAIADAFDAMTSTRSYREIISNEEALEEIIANSGTQFDPALVEVFKLNFKDIVNIDDK